MATESVSIVIKAFDQTQKALRGIKRAFAGLSKVFFSFKTALVAAVGAGGLGLLCLLYTSPSPRDVEESRMPSSA